MRSLRRLAAAGALVVFVALGAASALAQAPVPVVRVTFADAIQQAIKNNPTVAVASAGIVRAEGLLRQARAATLLQVSGNITTTTLNKGVDFAGTTVLPQNQITFTLSADMPILNAAAWARRAQAMDDAHVAELSTDEVRRQIALSTADAYLTVIAERRVVDANTRSRDVAKAHFDLADQLERQGTGSHLNALRAQQQWSTDEQLVEQASLALYRAQEALGVLIVADGPADAIDEPAFPVFDAPPDAAAPQAASSLILQRRDLKLFSAQQAAADRVAQDSSKDRWPSLDAVFVPSATRPAPAFSPANSWRFMLELNVPIFDSGQRNALVLQRQAALDVAKGTLAGATAQAASEVRAAREAVASGARSLASARDAAGQAQQVVNITNISFRAGAATNIEVIDAERTARDADNAVAVAEDTLRRARLALLDALGRFP
jgi:outer membrane protein